jgi:hypothetical protein
VGDAHGLDGGLAALAAVLRTARLEHEARTQAQARGEEGSVTPRGLGADRGSPAAQGAPSVRPLVDEQTRGVLERFYHHRRELLERSPSAGRDEDKLDLMVTRRMLKEGLPHEQVALALDIGSPRLSQRHPDSWAYAQQTVRTASEGPQKSASTPSRTTGGHDIDR